MLPVLDCYMWLACKQQGTGQGREHGAECPNRNAGLSDQGTAGQDLQKAVHDLRRLPLPSSLSAYMSMDLHSRDARGLMLIS